MNYTYNELAHILKLLSNTHRLQILCTLRNQELTVNQIHHAIPQISLSALSQHLSQLKLAGLLSSSKHGLHVVYMVQTPSIFQSLDALQNYTLTHTHIRPATLMSGGEAPQSQP